MFKSLNELDFIYKKLIDNLAWGLTPNLILEILSKWGFVFYWLFDMLAILSKIKFINLDTKYHTHKAFLGWFIGNVFMLVKLLLDLNALLKKKQTQDPNKPDPALEHKIFRVYLNVIGRIGDLIPSSNGIELPHKLFGRGFSDGVVGVGGFVSSVVALNNFINK